ncbi:zinc finger HIT domain-containing protein 3 [Dendropsophus ebraccatus]|uniref:zinc finger HIT domain-containing protein 3 n=1 Tax=Dendropsophus ebraccatus TaxID=150705 RepID=UPI003831DABC
MEDTCCVCAVRTDKYRCPGCRLRYCSLGCSKKHAEGCLPKETSTSPCRTIPPDMLPTKDNFPEDSDDLDAVPLQKLLLLGKSEELKDLLQNPHLRQLLRTLDQTAKKAETLRQFMQEPLFVEFADLSLSLLDAEEK